MREAEVDVAVGTVLACVMVGLLALSWGMGAVGGEERGLELGREEACGPCPETELATCGPLVCTADGWRRGRP